MVERYLAKVEVEGSSPFARFEKSCATEMEPPAASGGCCFPVVESEAGSALSAEVERRLKTDAADAVGAWYESRLGAARGSLGVYYTPWDLVERVLDAAVGSRPGAVWVCDPACGSGRFLVAAARRMARSGVPMAEAARRVRGVDVDGSAVRIARAALRELGLGEEEARDAVLHADALTDPRVTRGLAGRFDAVVGNAPFIDSERSARERPGHRAALRGAYESARGNFDLSTVFVEAGLRLARVGGVVALITPSRIISSDGAAALQRLALGQRVVGYLDLGHGRFEAGISTGVLVLRRTRRPAAEGSRVAWWGVEGGALVRRGGTTMGVLRRMPAGYLRGALEGSAEELLGAPAGCVLLGSVAEVGDGSTTAEAYQLATMVRECAGAEPGSGEARVVNTGLIEPGRLLWGERPMRLLGRVYRRPVVDMEVLERVQPRRARQARSWKVGVAGLSDRIEAAVCPPGVLCGKSVVVVTPREDVSAWALAEALNDERSTRLYRSLFGGRGFSARSMAIGPRQLERLPLGIGGSVS